MDPFFQATSSLEECTNSTLQKSSDVPNDPVKPMEIKYIFGKDVTTFKPHVKRKIAVLSEEVFHLNVRRRILLRKASELDYVLEDAILQEEYAENQKEMCKLTGMPEHEKTDLDKTREELLLRRMINIVRRRDRLLNDLDIERLREKEEDEEIKEEFKRLRQAWTWLVSQPNPEVPTNSSLRQIKPKKPINTFANMCSIS